MCVYPSSPKSLLVFKITFSLALFRVFTKDPARQASAELIELFETELSRSSLAAQQELGGVKLTDLPGPEALYDPGSDPAGVERG